MDSVLIASSLSVMRHLQHVSSLVEEPSEQWNFPQIICTPPFPSLKLTFDIWMSMTSFAGRRTSFFRLSRDNFDTAFIESSALSWHPEADS